VALCGAVILFGVDSGAKFRELAGRIWAEQFFATQAESVAARGADSGQKTSSVSLLVMPLMGFAGFTTVGGRSDILILRNGVREDQPRVINSL
jgi:hypothetical protein